MGDEYNIRSEDRLRRTKLKDIDLDGHTILKRFSEKQNL
jgi:hypothetical protein